MKRFIASLKDSVRGLALEPTIIMCGATAMLIISHYQGSTGYFYTALPSYSSHPAAVALSHFWWFGTSLIFYMFVPLIIAWATKGNFYRRFGLGLGDWRTGVTITVVFLFVMLPIAYVASKTSAFKNMYPLAGNGAFMMNLPNNKTEVSLKLFVLYELLYFSYFVGWEFLFRGWMLHGLYPYFGKSGALLVQMVPFAVMHLGKAEPEALGSIVAGIALGILALRTRSFWYGAVLHGCVAVWMDVVCAWPSLTA